MRAWPQIFWRKQAAAAERFQTLLATERGRSLFLAGCGGTALGLWVGIVPPAAVLPAPVHMEIVRSETEAAAHQDAVPHGPEETAPPSLAHAEETDHGHEHAEEVLTEGVKAAAPHATAHAASESHHGEDDHAAFGAILEDGALEPVPDLGLIEESAEGFLPRIGTDGRRPDQVYARPFEDPYDRPRIAIAVHDIGLGRKTSEMALRDLPPEVSVAVSPYATFPQVWTNQARAHGHEVLLHLPMESYGYPTHDAGPGALLTRLSASELTARLTKLLSRTTGYAGTLTVDGGAFLASGPDLDLVLGTLAERGVFFLEDGTSERSVARAHGAHHGLGYGKADRRLDTRPSRRNIDLALLELEAVARDQGQAIGIASALPVTVDRIVAWAPTLSAKGLVLAPVSAMMATSQLREGNQHAALDEP